MKIQHMPVYVDDQAKALPEREWELAETELEERDGGTWVSGLCPGCWERFAFRAPPRSRADRVRCPNGHPLVIRQQTSAGAHAHREAR